MHKEYPDPYLIDFKKLGNSEVGYISVAENGYLPFEIKRVFWTYHTPESIVRGRHSHHETEQILIATSGRIVVTAEKAEGTVNTYVLDKPNVGLYIPPYVWHTMQYSHISTQVVLASTLYDEKDYIRGYSEFKNRIQ